MYIFCDEAGFTGNNLLDAEQDIFAYATVAMDPEVARERVARIIRDFRVQGKELKGGRLVKSSAGRRAVTQLLEECRGQYKTVAHLKAYALAGKLFEYIFEPPLANQNSFFYDLEFHKFISVLLFSHFRAKDRPTEQLMQNFSTFAREGDEDALSLIIAPDRTKEYRSNPLHAISKFAMLHRGTISREISDFTEPGVPNWILDLTTTSFFGLMCSWAEEFDELDVTCDASKPLESAVSFLNGMVGRTEKVRIKMFGKDRPYSFNLRRPIQLGNSHEQPGLQIADVVASATATLIKSQYRRLPDQSELKKWEPLIKESLGDDNIWPDYEMLDWENPKCFVNTAVLMELVDRSINNEDLFDRMPAFALSAFHGHREFLAARGNSPNMDTTLRESV
jgi:uncharacterized protein DUF3800